VRALDPMKAKHLGRAVTQCVEEGAAKVFKPIIGSGYIVGVVGQLQFEVLASRIEEEYSLPVRFEPSQFTSACWVSGPKAEMEKMTSVNKGHRPHRAGDRRGYGVPYPPDVGHRPDRAGFACAEADRAHGK